VTDLSTTLRSRLQDLAPDALEIRDDGADHVGHAGEQGGAEHFSLLIVSKAFCDKSLLERHQTVLYRVNDLIPYPIHALSIKALAPEELS